ncbi:MAG: hypothetical protein QT08_C0009G0042 [archaeon GW2011_AR17]|nr:MAG: hypothetical protein QT08_C0009G0042 [archaeon GW2011_AR17]MBS3154167.1 hypothetical protein [Candidatus Woesearchaeota archaeon]HIH14796.1 hypothetical protein [Nanoarchaeota archaeon]HIH59053.1 hypothetical protein [Nanoarchaeota archaeon]HII14441.1 hypothetical protein [Nanoarchaeota archaeon]
MKQIRYVEKAVPFYQNKKFLTILMGLFIISIMVFSVLYYGLDTNGQEKVEYNGLEFVQTTQGWLAYTEDEQRILLFGNPQDAEGLRFDAVSLSFLSDVQKLYLSFNPDDDFSSALSDFQQNAGYSGALVVACSQEHELCGNLPIRTCADATSTIGVILFDQANESSVVLEGNCLTIQGKNLLSITDKLILDQYA